MRIVRLARCRAVVAALLCVLLTSTSQAARIQPPPLERYPGTLAETLQRYGMTELLTALTRTLADSAGAESADALHVAAKTWVALAAKPDTPADKREALLDRAEALYERLVRLTAQPRRGLNAKQTRAQFAALLRHCRIRVEYGELLARRVEMAGWRLVHLEAAPGDAPAVARLATKAATVLGQLEQDLRTHMGNMRVRGGRGVIWSLRLESLHRRAEYRASWVGFFAMAARNDRGSVAGTGSQTRPGRKR